jgi:NAD-dependent SIR2 family protein deacetylase
MYTSSFYNFKTEEEKWSYWSKHINYLELSMKATNTYKKLYDIIKDKNYFVITTNVDRQFIKSGFDSKKVFEVQGTLSKIQCAKSCHNKLYDNTKIVQEMLKYKNDIKIPTSLVPTCPVCGGSMEVNLRKDNYFVEDDYWLEHNNAFEKFIQENKNKKILFLELGAGFNTPGIIRYPFEYLTNKLDNAYLIRVNDTYDFIPENIQNKSSSYKMDINKFIEELGDEIERENTF